MRHYRQRVSGEIQMDLWGAALASYAERARYLTRERLQAEHDHNVEAHLDKFSAVTAAELERRKVEQLKLGVAGTEDRATAETEADSHGRSGERHE